MLSIGIVIGAALAGPVAFVLGLFVAADRRVSHERADIRPALRRSR